MLILFVISTSFFSIPPAKVNASSQAQTLQTADTDWWPTFHHDLTHSGYSNSPAPTTNHILWNYTTGGYVWRSFAIVNGIVYFGSNDMNLYALNASTGTLAWKYKTGNAVNSPTVADGIVYVAQVTAMFTL